MGDMQELIALTRDQNVRIDYLEREVVRLRKALSAIARDIQMVTQLKGGVRAHRDALQQIALDALEEKHA